MDLLLGIGKVKHKVGQPLSSFSSIKVRASSHMLHLNVSVLACWSITAHVSLVHAVLLKPRTRVYPPFCHCAAFFVHTFLCHQCVVCGFALEL